MDFSYPDSHTDIKNLTGDILGDFSSPERLKKLENNGPYFDSDVWQKLAETGLLAASLPESMGGTGMTYSASSHISETLGSHIVSVPYIPCIISCALPLLLAREDREVTRRLTAIGSGEQVMVPALLEVGDENPLTAQTSASNDSSNNNWRISGSKQLVPYAAHAHSVLVAAQQQGEVWLGLVDIAQPGVVLTEQYCTANEPQYMIEFDQANAHRIASGELAQTIIQQSLDMTTVAYCSMAVGLCETMTKISAEYTSQREQFGVPIATFQAVAHRLASSYIDTECLRIATLKAVSDVTQAANTESISHSNSLSIAKVWCGDALHRVSQASQHVHGGAGIDRDYHLFRFCLWAKQLELSLGCSKFHLDQIANNLEEKYLAFVA